MNNLLSIYHITHGGDGRTMEFTPDSVIIQDLESREIITTRVVDHSSHLYTFADFYSNDGIVPSTIDDTSSVKYDLEETFGFLNLGLITSDLVLEKCISSPPSIVVVDDTCDSTFLVPYDSVF